MTIFGFIGVLGRHPAYYQSRGTATSFWSFLRASNHCGAAPAVGRSPAAAVVLGGRPPRRGGPGDAALVAGPLLFSPRSVGLRPHIRGGGRGGGGGEGGA